MVKHEAVSDFSLRTLRAVGPPMSCACVCCVCRIFPNDGKILRIVVVAARAARGASKPPTDFPTVDALELALETESLARKVLRICFIFSQSRDSPTPEQADAQRRWCAVCDRPWCRKLYETFSTSRREREPSNVCKVCAGDARRGRARWCWWSRQTTTLTGAAMKTRVDGGKKNTGRIHVWDCVSLGENESIIMYWVRRRRKTVFGRVGRLLLKENISLFAFATALDSRKLWAEQTK